MFDNQVKEAFQWDSTTYIARNRFALPKLQQENCPSKYVLWPNWHPKINQMVPFLHTSTKPQ